MILPTCLQECYRSSSELTSQLQELQQLVDGVQNVASSCTGALGSLGDAAAVFLDSGSAVIGLTAYVAVSMLWGLARVVHHCWTGPNGGRFPPDAFMAALFIRVVYGCWTAVKIKLSQPLTVRLPATGAVSNSFRRVARGSQVEEVIDSEMPWASQTGIPGPAFSCTMISELSEADHASEGTAAVKKCGFLSSVKAVTSTPLGGCLSDDEGSYGSASSDVTVKGAVIHHADLSGLSAVTLGPAAAADILPADSVELAAFILEPPAADILSIGEDNIDCSSADKISAASVPPAADTVMADTEDHLAVSKASLAVDGCPLTHQVCPITYT